MKPLLYIAMISIAAFLPATAEFRTFIGSNGDAIKAELVSHSGGKLKIKREDGREFEVDPAIFCQADEKYIREWMANQVETLRYAFKTKADKKVTDRGGDSSSSYGKWSYEISITNNSQDTVNHLKIQYRVLYYKYGEKMLEGEEELKQDLKFNRTLVITTPSVTVYKSRYDDSRNSELKGCLVRILDGNGQVIEDWVSKEVGMKDKTWENTTPKEGVCDAPPPPVIR